MEVEPDGRVGAQTRKEEAKARGPPRLQTLCLCSLQCTVMLETVAEESSDVDTGR